LNQLIFPLDVISSQDPLSGRKQVFDSQSKQSNVLFLTFDLELEQHLLSVDDFKPSNFGQKGNVRESGGNLIKKSIETGFVEQI